MQCVPPPPPPLAPPRHAHLSAQRRPAAVAGVRHAWLSAGARAAPLPRPRPSLRPRRTTPSPPSLEPPEPPERADPGAAPQRRRRGRQSSRRRRSTHTHTTPLRAQTWVPWVPPRLGAAASVPVAARGRARGLGCVRCVRCVRDSAPVPWVRSRPRGRTRPCPRPRSTAPRRTRPPCAPLGRRWTRPWPTRRRPFSPRGGRGRTHMHPCTQPPPLP